ncbi:UNVERIFIED_CONTAM: hypothetical protein Scaly_1068900 [Sesamum calycinum]|uniref:Uncharacterized protein n=1 Tax=Sesamum calycinum TaxID=2727403 RepID=A0AAW2QLW8_9LAMI
MSIDNESEGRNDVAEGEGNMGISLNAISGSTDSNIFKVKVKAYGKDLQLLIVGRNTHFFIDEKTALWLGCKLELATPMVVNVANGYKMEGLPPSRGIEYPILLKPDAMPKKMQPYRHFGCCAFEQLKNVMTTTPVLALPDFSKPFVVKTNASYKGIRVVLMQDHRPIAYLNKVLRLRNQGLSVYEKEFLAILLAISKLLGLDYEVQYKRGYDDKTADALSRQQQNDGITWTYKRLKSTLYWNKLKKDVVTWVQSCDVCYKAKARHVPYPGLLQPLPIHDQSCTSISIDFIEGLPKSEAEYWYNTNFHASLKPTPFKALYGCLLGSLNIDPYTPTTQPEVADYLVFSTKVLARRLISQKQTVFLQVLIQWNNYTPDEATWEDYYDIVSRLPNFYVDPRGQGTLHQGALLQLLKGRR